MTTTARATVQHEDQCVRVTRWDLSPAPVQADTCMHTTTSWCRRPCLGAEVLVRPPAAGGRGRSTTRLGRAARSRWIGRGIPVDADRACRNPPPLPNYHVMFHP